MNESREIERIPMGMRPGRRELNEASLRVSMSEAVPPHMRTRVREISHVYCVPEARKKRLATALLNFVCQEADANGITLLLTARPSDDEGPPEETLVKWYQKFGFTQLQDTPNGILMARQVHEKPRIKTVPVAAAVRAALNASQVH